MDTIPSGTRVMLEDPDYGPQHGRVVVCLCKRHTWQRELLGYECKHGDCGYPRAASACPWPVHVVWDGDGNESHQNAFDLVTVEPRLRSVPNCSGEAAIYSPEYLERTQGPRGVFPLMHWRNYIPC
ncbi:hypothetical protein ACWC1C_01175 [Streptomyces sp. NPDC001705]